MSDNTSIVTISNVHAYLDKDGTVWLNAEDVARGLGFTQTAASGNEVVRWERVNKYLREFNFIPTNGDGIKAGDYIPENMFYRLAMKANNSVAEKFQAKVADEILPTIRKTGGYGNNAIPRTDLVRFAELVTRLDPSVHKTIVDAFLASGSDVPQKKEEPAYVEIKPTPMDSAIKTISVRQLIDDYLVPAGIAAILHSDGSVSKLCPKPVCQYLVKYHRDALPFQRNPSTSYKDRLVNVERVDNIISSLKQHNPDSNARF